MTIRALALLCAASCAGGITHARLSPDEFEGRPVAAASRVSLGRDGDDRGVVEIGSGGVFTTTLSPRRLRVLHLRVTVRNADAGTIRVPLGELAIEGIGDGRLRPVTVFGERDEGATTLVVPSGAVRSVDVVFALPGASDVIGFRFFWGVDLPGYAVRTATLFDASDVPGLGVARVPPAESLE